MSQPLLTSVLCWAKGLVCFGALGSEAANRVIGCLWNLGSAPGRNFEVPGGPKCVTAHLTNTAEDPKEFLSGFEI